VDKKGDGKMIDFELLLMQTLTNTISGLVINAPWLIMLWLGFKMISKEIAKGVKEMPKWINQYQDFREKENRIKWARGIRSN